MLKWLVFCKLKDNSNSNSMSNTKKGEQTPKGNGTPVQEKSKDAKTVALNAYVEELTRKIQFSQVLAEKVKHRHILQAKLDLVRDLELKDEDHGGFLEEKSEYRVTLADRYDRKVLSIANDVLVSDFIDFFSKKCEERIQKLDTEILSM